MKLCGHRAPRTYDHSAWSTCTRPAGHDGNHDDGAFEWKTGYMPWKKAAGLNPPDLPPQRERRAGPGTLHAVMPVLVGLTVALVIIALVFLIAGF